MKRLFSLLLILCLLFSGCGRLAEEPTTEATTEATTVPTTEATEPSTEPPTEPPTEPEPVYYNPLTGEEMDDFNCPESINYDGLYEKVLEIKKDPEVQVLIVEGNGIFYHEKIRQLFDLKIFMDLEIEHRMYRRIVRNIAAGRGSMEDIAGFYLKSARFSEQKYLIPTKRFADVVLNGDNYDPMGIDVVETFIRKNI